MGAKIDVWWSSLRGGTTKQSPRIAGDCFVVVPPPRNDDLSSRSEAEGPCENQGPKLFFRYRRGKAFLSCYIYKLVLPEAVLIRPGFQDLRIKVNESVQINKLLMRDESAFEEAFKSNYKSLHAYAITMIRDEMAAEEIVQNVFYKLWDRTDNLSIKGSLRAYLYRAVHNEALNYVKHMKVRSEHQLYVSHNMNESSEHAGKKIQLKELEEKLQAALNDLPEQCRTIFQMSRFEELRYREIADRLDLSVKTVENQMGKALKILRTKLAEFLTLILLFINIKP